MTRHVLAALAFTIAPAVLAQTYIVPEGDCGEVTLHVTAVEAPVAHAYVYQPRQRIAVTPVAAGMHSLEFSANVAEGAVVMAGIDFQPRIHGSETRTDHAKVLLFCGPNAPVADWQRSAGLGFELFPQEWNPLRAHMKAGDTLRFIAVDMSAGKGNFLRELPMELHRADGTLVATGTQARSGGMNFVFPNPGQYVVTATYRREDPAAAGHWLVDTSTLTFEVK